MSGRAAFAAAMLLAPAAAAAQDHAMHGMPGMTMPPAAKPRPVPRLAAPERKPAPSRSTPAASPAGRPAGGAPAMPTGHDHSHHGDMDAAGAGAPSTGAVSAMPGMDMAGPLAAQAGGGEAARGTDLSPGAAAPPPMPIDHYADRSFAPSTMAAARRRMMREEGGRIFYQLLFNLAEVQAGQGRDSYRWDGEGWFGGDIDRVVLKSEGEGAFRGGPEQAEVQALWSHAIGPYFNLQLGLRQDLAGPRRPTFLSAGVEGLAPYWFQTEARLFVGSGGQVRGRLEAWLDQRLTQRLVLQPRVELDLAAQNERRARIGAGLSEAELGLRLRYELRREVAPYLGLSYVARTGRSADYARADGDRASAVGVVLGLRGWF